MQIFPTRMCNVTAWRHARLCVHWLMTPVGAGEGGGGWLEGEVCILRSPGISAFPISDANFPDQNVQRHSVTSLETVRSLANDPSWSVGGGGGGCWLREKYVFCVPREFQRLRYLMQIFPTRMCNVTAWRHSRLCVHWLMTPVGAGRVGWGRSMCSAFPGNFSVSYIWCKFSRPECATSQRDVTRDCAFIGLWP